VKEVNAGAKFLDEHRPGWEDEIDLDTLDLASTCGCVLGQLHGRDHPYSRLGLRFDRMLSRLGLDEDDACRLGFDIYDPDGDYDDSLFDKLTASWKRLIRKRRRV
jgi:hypothetical protein